MSGFDPTTGYQPPTVDELITDVEADELATISPSLNLSPVKPIGQLNGIMMSRVAICHELLQTAFNQFDDTKCEGPQLDGICALTGTFRKGPLKGLVTVSCTLTLGATLNDNHVIKKTGDDTNRWTPKVPFTAPSAGVHPVVFECEREGEVILLAGDPVEIVTPVAGWTVVSIPSDATPGRDVEKDPALRVRRRQELGRQGSASCRAIRANLLRVTGVINAIVRENETMYVDANGLPPKSIQAIVWDGDPAAAANADIWAAIFAHKGGGIQAHGFLVGVVVDEYGKNRIVRFDRAVKVPITIDLALTVGAGFPGIAAVKSRIVDWDGKLQADPDNVVMRTLDDDVIRSVIMGIALSIPGVLDVTSCQLNGTGGNISIAEDQIATFNTADINVST